MNSARKLERRPHGPLLSDHEFAELRDLFVKLTGNKLGPDKRTLLESRILKRLNETRLSPSSYLGLVRSDSHEREVFISTLTTHKTDWFREPIHIEFLANTVSKPEFSLQSKPVTIWSAACSSGEEVYSICMALLAKEFSHFRVLGTDISECCLKKARAGIFSANQIDMQVPTPMKDAYFRRCAPGKSGAEYRISENMQKWVKWRKFNLLEDALPARVQFDFIFLRNVLIYFKQDDVEKVIQNLHGYLKPGGFLITGLSEYIASESQFNLRRVGNSIYRYEK